MLQALSVSRLDSRQAILCVSPRRKPELGQELGQGTWTNFITCFPLIQVRPGNLDKELGQLRAAVLQALLVLRPDSKQAPIPTSWPRAETRTWTRTWTRNLDKFYHVFSSCRATCPSSPGELGQGTWTTCGLPCYKLSHCAPIPGRQFRVPRLSSEGVFQMDSILPERLPALVRPAFDLVLRRIRSLKRCVQACGCKIMTPRYAPQFGSRLHFTKETPFPFFSGTPFFGTPFFLFFWFFLSPAKVGSLEMQPGAKLQAYLGVIILQPHASHLENAL